MSSSTAPHRVLLAGSGSSTQDHLRDIYLPALLARPDTAVSVWDDGDGRAQAMATAYSLPVVTDLETALGEHTATIACARPDDVDRIVSASATAATPLLLDKPTLLGTETLATLAAAHENAAVGAGHFWRFHPAVGAARVAANSGRLGLLHSVHGELLVGGPDAPHPDGELRNLVVHALDAITSVVGPLRGRGYAVSQAPADGAGEAWTLTLRLEPDTIVSLLVGRAGPDVTETVHRYRFVGSHGQLLADLAGPRVDVVGATRRSVTFGPGPVDLLLQAFLDGALAGVPDLAATLATSRVLDALDSSISTQQPHTFGDDA